MSVNRPTHPRTRARGITLVEILMAIAVLIILVAFALPSAGSAAARAEMQAALENLEYSVGAARNVARLTESSVSLLIESPSAEAAQSITFSGMEKTSRERQPEIQDYRFPESIKVVSDQERFVFDRRGLVEQPGRILLVSRADEEISATLDID